MWASLRKERGYVCFSKRLSFFGLMSRSCGGLILLFFQVIKRSIRHFFFFLWVADCFRQSRCFDGTSLLDRELSVSAHRYLITGGYKS